MPLIVQDHLPAIETLENEGLFIMSPTRAKTQDIRPLKIALVNLMPDKMVTETQFMRLLSNTALQIEFTLLRMGSHYSKNTNEEYLRQFYKTLKQVENMRFDGMIITGAPVENLEFRDVDYWNELKELMDYTKGNVFSTMHVCWGAQAGLFHHYGIKKHGRSAKCFGVYPHAVNPDNDLLFKGSNDSVIVCHSRHTEWDEAPIAQHRDLKIVLKSRDAGVCVVTANEARQIFISGHFEYDRDRLRNEYLRDVQRGLDIGVPENYFPDDDPSYPPVVTWQSDANLFFSNWLNHVVYQGTPYDLNKLEPLE